jgi:hypothetical protein
MPFTSKGEDKQAQPRRYERKVLTSIFGEIEMASDRTTGLCQERLERAGEADMIWVGLPEYRVSGPYSRGRVEIRVQADSEIARK